MRSRKISKPPGGAARGRKKFPSPATSADVTDLSKSRFPADISHDIRTPMNDVIGMQEQQLAQHDMRAEGIVDADEAPLTLAEPAVRDELKQVQEMFGANFAELAALFLADSPKRIAALRAAAAESDAAQAARVAHALSGSTSSIGASGLSALCKELESRAKSGALEDMAARLTAIELEYAKVDATLRSMVHAMQG